MKPLATAKNLLAAVALLGTFAGGVMWLTEIIADKIF